MSEKYEFPPPSEIDKRTYGNDDWLGSPEPGSDEAKLMDEAMARFYERHPELAARKEALLKKAAEKAAAQKK